MKFRTFYELCSQYQNLAVDVIEFCKILLDFIESCKNGL
jgi:hypothetical protein